MVDGARTMRTRRFKINPLVFIRAQLSSFETSPPLSVTCIQMYNRNPVGNAYSSLRFPGRSGVIVGRTRVFRAMAYTVRSQNHFWITRDIVREPRTQLAVSLEDPSRPKQNNRWADNYLTRILSGILLLDLDSQTYASKWLCWNVLSKNLLKKVRGNSTQRRVLPRQMTWTIIAD